MKKLITSIRTSAVLATSTLLAPVAASAQDNPFLRAQEESQRVGEEAGVGNQQELPVIIGSIINILLGFVGIVLLLIILYAGFQWMTAGGDSKKVEEAKQRIGNAVVGLIILVAAFAISNFVLGSLVNVTQ